MTQRCVLIGESSRRVVVIHMVIRSRTKNEIFDLTLDVERIEVQAIVRDSEDELNPEYFRTIRITCSDGEILEILCTAPHKEKLEVSAYEELPES
jgi:hypothetical protein